MHGIKRHHGKYVCCLLYGLLQCLSFEEISTAEQHAPYNFHPQKQQWIEREKKPIRKHKFGTERKKMRFGSKGTWIWFQYMHDSASQISPLIWRCLFSYLFTMLTIPFNSFVKHNFVCFFIRYRLCTLKIGCSWRCALYFLNICSTSRSCITYPNRISLSVGFKYMIHMHAYTHRGTCETSISLSRSL